VDLRLLRTDLLGFFAAPGHLVQEFRKRAEHDTLVAGERPRRVPHGVNGPAVLLFGAWEDCFDVFALATGRRSLGCTDRSAGTPSRTGAHGDLGR
jgi:hypothetical protein